jgi:hypothetical protein
MITGVRFVRCINHPDTIAQEWQGKDNDRHPYCSVCLRPGYDALAVRRMRHDPRASDALDAYAAALKAGSRREVADTKRTVRLYLSLGALRTFERHLSDLAAERKA